MKVLLHTLSLLLALLSIACCQQQQPDLLGSLPACALSCFESTSQNSTCALQDAACLCGSPQWNAETSACVTRNCSIKEQLSTRNMTSIWCKEPVSDRSKVIETANLALWGVALLSVIVRIAARWACSNSGLGLDDWTILFTVFVSTFSTFIVVALAMEGLGRHLWTIPFSSITSMFKHFFALAILYKLSSALNKISILFFYLRIFPRKPFRFVVYTFMGITVVTTVGLVLADFLQCRPVSLFWNKWEGTYQGHCVSFDGIAWSHGGINVFLDASILVMPLYEVSQLQLPWQKRATSALMFSVGSAVTFITILRLQSLIIFSKTLDPSWDFYSVIFWSMLEVDIGIVCACMPAFRLIFTRVIPGFRSYGIVEPQSPLTFDSGRKWPALNIGQRKQQSANDTAGKDPYGITEPNRIHESDLQLAVLPREGSREGGIVSMHVRYCGSDLQLASMPDEESSGEIIVARMSALGTVERLDRLERPGDLKAS